MKTILIIGKNGQLAWELQRTCAPLGRIVALDYPEIDLAKPEGLRTLMQELKPAIVLNAAAYTQVDRAESEVALARAVNASGPAVLAEEARKLRAVFMHWSTDYVFDGQKGSPYFEDDPSAPLNIYGQSKLEGEQAVLNVGAAGIILRTSWVYSMRQGGFVSKVLQWARNQEVMRVVDDQISGPTSARLLAEVAALLLAQGGGDPYSYLEERAGLYHCAGEGSCSRYDWARAILELDPRREQQCVKSLERAKSADFPVPALRPAVSVLSNEKLHRVFGLGLPDWREGLQLCMNES